MAFRASVEAWRPLAEQFSGDAPTDYLLDWMEKESGGNRCNLTTSAGFNEVGLFQLDDGNAKMAGVDLMALRNGCDGQVDASGTADDQLLAMSSGVDYIKALKSLAHQRLAAAGADWDESTPDFWSYVRLHHAAGSGAALNWLQAAVNNLGRGPQNWDEFVSASGAASNHWVGVSAENGSWAAGFSPSTISSLTSGAGLSGTEIVLVGLAAIAGVIGALYFQRWLTGEAV